MSELLLGTSSWTASGWVGPFYPPGTPSSEFLPHYASRFSTVEIDSTWYRCPSERTVDGWRDSTPDGFTFAAKAPRTITHERVLLGCEDELEQFLTVMRRLETRLGPILFQFPYFKPTEIPNLPVFLGRLGGFLPLLPPDLRFALEIRNRAWLQRPLFELLRAHRVALAWIDHPWMPRPRQWGRLSGAITTDFLYMRLLGDRAQTEALTQTWDHVVCDRERETAEWAELFATTYEEVASTRVYVNNHFSGYAPESAQLLLELWESLLNRPDRSRYRG